MANSEHLAIVKQGKNAIDTLRRENPNLRLDLTEANLREVRLSGADLRGADLYGADLYGADLSEASLRKANLGHATLTTADLSRANLCWADLTMAILNFTDIGHAEFFEADFTGAHLLAVTNPHLARGLTITKLDQDVKYFETFRVPKIERCYDWQVLRTFGRLPLFGASYTILIMIPIFFYGLAFYNKNVVRASHEFSKQVLAERQLNPLPDQTHTWGNAAISAIQQHLQPLPIPSQSLLLLVSTMFLAVASSIYIFCCPARVKEFTRDQWRDQFGKSLLHYWPFAWKFRPLSAVCAVCYVLGGLGAVWVIATKVFRTARFILENSEFSLL